MSAEQQVQVFAAMVLCGALVGAVYDLLGVFRRGALSAAAADLALGPICAAGVTLTALQLRCEAFRLYTLLGAALGWAIYAASLGRIVRVLHRNFIKLSNKVTN